MPYIDQMYGEVIRPRGTYPRQLCSHLLSVYGSGGGAPILDLGCGRGDFSEAFKSLGLEVYSCDLESSKYHEGLNVSYFNSEEDVWPYEDNSLSMIFTKSVLEHIKNPEHFFTEARRVLKDNGKLIVLVPDWESQYKTFYDDPTHVRPYTAEGLKFTFEKYRFNVLDCSKFYQLPLFWRFPILKHIKLPLSVRAARNLTEITGLKYFRWSTETMVIGVGIKWKNHMTGY